MITINKPNRQPARATEPEASQKEQNDGDTLEIRKANAAFLMNKNGITIGKSSRKPTGKPRRM